MKQTFKALAVGLLLASAALQADGCCNNSCGKNSVTSAISPRSQSRDISRKMVGMRPDQIYLEDMDNLYGTLNMTFGYTSTFRSDRLAKCLFGSAVDFSCDDATIHVSGTGVEDRGANHLMAENFLLPSTYQTTVTLDPDIKNFLIDFHLYVGLDEWVEGLYFRIYAPFVHTRWDLDWNESPATGTATETAGGYAAGFLGAEATNATDLNSSFTSYMRGNPLGTVNGIQTSPLCCSRISCGTETKNGLADLRAELGWNFMLEEDYHVGLNIQMAAPTGNRPDGCLLFEPIIGNGKHWELGGGFSMHYTLWRSEDADSQFDFNLEADITHMFKAKQRRCLDLKCKPLSRFMLAAKHGTPVENLGNVAANTPNRQFKSEVSPVANLTNQEVDVSISVQGDLAAYFTYQRKGFTWDIGYNFWGRSCEDVDFRDCSDACDNTGGIAANTWTLKGDAQAFGFDFISGAPIALSFSQSNATIFAGVSENNSSTPGTNANIDSAVTATNSNSTSTVNLSNQGGGFANNINTSVNPIFISNDDVDLVGTRDISHKLFTHFNYSWEREDYTPYVGFGASVEFGKTESSDCGSSCGTTTGSSTVTSTTCNTGCNTGCDTDSDSNCLDCAISQWGIFLKVGVSFQ